MTQNMPYFYSDLTEGGAETRAGTLWFTNTHPKQIHNLEAHKYSDISCLKPNYYYIYLLKTKQKWLWPLIYLSYYHF